MVDHGHSFRSVYRQVAWLPGLLAGAVLLGLPLLLQSWGHHWVRVADMCLLYLLLALGMNIIVGYAGLLDLGFVGFYALGAYVVALLSSPHLSDTFAGLLLWFPDGLHAPPWLTLPLGVCLAALLGMAFGGPTLKLRGDYLAIVTLAFGEIVRLLLVNLGDAPLNLTNGARGVGPMDPLRIAGWPLDRPLQLGPLTLAPVTLHFYVFALCVACVLVLCHRLEQSRWGRAWQAIRDDEVAAEAMGLPVSRLKLMAFALGAGIGGMAGGLFASFQGFVSPEAFTLQESVFIVAMVVFGGMGHLSGVLLGALILTALPEVLRYVVGPLQSMTEGRLDAGMVRPLMIAAVMIVTMRLRPHGLWPKPEWRGGITPAATKTAAPTR